MTEHSSTGEQFPGLYSAIVKDNKDPDNLGKLLVSVTAIYGDSHEAWAWPCIPYAGKDVGLYLIPPKETRVWVMFEGGNLDRPVWMGCYWTSQDINKVKELASSPDQKLLLTEKASVLIDDADNGKITIKLGSDKKVEIEKEKITFTSGSSTIEMTSSKVDVNGGNLEVLV